MRRMVLAAFCLTPIAMCSLFAQQPELELRPEVRADLIVGHQPAAQLGVGVQVPAGPYVRIGVVAAGGVRLDDVRPRGDARVDLLGRFLLDPYRQSPVGLSVGGGISVRAEPGDRARPFLLVAAELEGRPGAGGWSPAVQLGLAGGLRVGAVLRRGAGRAR